MKLCNDSLCVESYQLNWIDSSYYKSFSFVFVLMPKVSSWFYFLRMYCVYVSMVSYYIRSHIHICKQIYTPTRTQTHIYAYVYMYDHQFITITHLHLIETTQTVVNVLVKFIEMWIKSFMSNHIYWLIFSFLFMVYFACISIWF